MPKTEPISVCLTDSPAVLEGLDMVRDVLVQMMSEGWDSFALSTQDATGAAIAFLDGLLATYPGNG